MILKILMNFSNNLLREDEKIISDILALGGRKPVWQYVEWLNV
jgi:hypothetical protein